MNHFAKHVLGVAALLMIALVVVGFALPGTWEVTRERFIEAPPEELWPRIADLRGWDDWTALGEVEAEFSDPSTGVGATRAWDSEDWGSGRVEVVASAPPSRFAYEVRVEDGALRTTGEIRLIPEVEGTRVVWTEQGDFGWNPILGFMALGMNRMQGTELQKSLDALQALAEPDSAR